MALCAFFLTGGVALAQDLKVGVVDLQKVLEQSEPGQKALSHLKDRFEGMKSKLETKKQELDQLRQQIQKQSLVLSQEAKIDKQTEYKQKARDFQDLYQSYKRKMQLKEQQLREPIIETLVKVVDEYGKEHDYTVILDKNNSGVVFNQKAVEITEKIIARLNETWSEQDKALKLEKGEKK
jgi:outer membrane protein